MVRWVSLNKSSAIGACREDHHDALDPRARTLPRPRYNWLKRFNLLGSLRVRIRGSGRCGTAHPRMEDRRDGYRKSDRERYGEDKRETDRHARYKNDERR